MEIKLKKDAPIGVFDSGVGGISVLRELVHIMPNENYLYFGDSLHAPYGTKTLEEVRKLTIANIEKLLNDGAKGIVVACNTATSAAVAILRKMYPSVPLVGIEPAIKPAVLQKPGSRIVVMATPMTLKQEKFQKLMKQYEKDAQIISLPCPGLMEFVERGDLDGDDLKKYYMHYISNGINEGRNGVDPDADSYTIYKGVDYADVYDYEYYRDHNDDIKETCGDDKRATLIHFVKSSFDKTVLK